MASSGNFSTFNPLDNATTAGYGNCTFANGNTETTGASTGHCGITSTIATGNTGKYYAEFYLVATSGNAYLGYYSSQQTITMITASNKWVPSSSVTWNPANLASYFQTGTLYKDGSTTSSWGASFTTTDIIQIAIDADNDAVYYGKNNTWQNSGNPESGASKTGAARTSIPKNVLPAVGHANGGSSTVTWRANFGQDSTFGGTISAGGNADANGFGDFKYAPPSGYVALCTANLPVSDDIDPAQTDDEYPAKNFNTVIWTGNQSTQAITGVGFKPDLVWLKQRAGSGNPNILTDSSRGVTKRLESNADIAEGTDSDGLTAFGTDGFTLGSNDKYNYGSGWTYVGWSWKANGGTTTSFSSGGNQLAGTYQANTKSKFSIITYTGSGSTGEVLHGMSATPNFIIAKDRGATYWWNVYHKSGGTVNTGYDSLLYLNSNNAVASGQNVNIVPDSTKISMAGNEQINKSGNTYVMYAWADVEGMQKFGKYEGNGNSDGPFIYLGFRPRMMCIKSMDSNQAWIVCDTARETFNPLGEKVLQWNTNDQEYDPSGFNWDALSNGFKIRSSDTNINATQTYIYMAWGDVPFKYNNTF